jgi:hypothetical protein
MRLHGAISRNSERCTGKQSPRTHMWTMALTKDPDTDASHHATAIARWEEEGGATDVSPRRAKPDLKQQKTLGAPLANDSKQEDSKSF